MTIYIQTGTHTSNMKPIPKYSGLSGFLKDYKGQPELVPELDQDPQSVKDTKAFYVISGEMVNDGTAPKGFIHRCNKTVLSRDNLLLDLDNISPGIQSEEELLKKLEEFYDNFEFFVWPTISNGLTYGNKHHGEMRYRVCLPLQKSLNKDDYQVAVKMELADLVKNGILTKVDNSNKTWSQCFGLPIRGKAFHKEGDLKFYPNREDLEKFKAELVKEKNKATQTPLTVPTTTNSKTAGDTGLSVPEAIRKLTNEGPKWQALWNGDISEAGYDSQSEADLALANKLCFYLGKNPEAIDEAFRNSGLIRDKWDEKHYSSGETYGRHTIMQAIAGVTKTYTRTKKASVTAVYKFGPEIINSKQPAKQGQRSIDPSEIASCLETNENGKVAKSIGNLGLILEYDSNLQGLFQYNEFTEDTDVMKDIVLTMNEGEGNQLTVRFKKGYLTDSIANSLMLYCNLNQYYKVSFSKDTVFAGIDITAHNHTYNPAVDYLNTCRDKWDKTARIPDFFPEFLGADKNEANTLIAKLFFLGVVAKIYDPSTKYDYVLDLVGGQGVGKTTLLHKLAPLGAYKDGFTDFHDRDNILSMRHQIIVNDDEMVASNNKKVSFGEIKSFVTEAEFEVREPYARKPLHFKKKFVLCRTTNEVRHLKDKSGDRRFNSIMCHPEKQKRHPVTDLDQGLVNQLWGEAVACYESYEDKSKIFALTKEQNELLEKSRQEFLYTSSLEDTLLDILDNEFADADFIKAAALWEKMGLKKGDKTTKDTVTHYMEHRGWKGGQVRKVNGQSARGFARIKK